MATAREMSLVNKDFLVEELGLKQQGNSTIFMNEDCFVLSPSVQRYEKGFDVSEFNLAKFDPERQQGFLLVRYMDTFLMAKLESFTKKMMLPELQIKKKNTKPHWKFTVAENPAYHIVNTQNKELRYRLQEPTKKQILSFFNKI
ncbi:hypothetical protein FQV26_03080 [Planococcus sp. CPCC 101016]|uniref:hypothetical protein n=1 Tax=Planococcus sp. CPCC 101016 TaxID=2599617 RepID=UPI0011B5D00A|nr:hypothetical protein [Planococcus sp. CPCC 101016]TWT06808.1 hypothetical protein FQV26_03080 [Planococcus sp. CPCC 101016]